MTLRMVRSASGGRLADEFVENGLVALGAAPVGGLSQFSDKQALMQALRQERPDFKPGRVQAAASQWIRFRDEVQQRSNIPLMLWDLDDLVQALVENYDSADQETRALIPLTRLFWPV